MQRWRENYLLDLHLTRNNLINSVLISVQEGTR